MTKNVGFAARRFRDRFVFGTNDLTHYFPGHMQKGTYLKLRLYNG